MLINDFYNYQHSYNKVFDLSCLHNAVRQVLEYYKVEKALLFINSAFNLNVLEDTSGILGFELDLNDTNVVLPTYSNKLYISSQSDFEDYGSLFEDNKRRVHSGVPVITVIDTFYLSYSINYNKAHNLHANIFCGYSENSDRIYIVDWFSPWFFKGEISYEEYYRGRNSSNPLGEGLFGGRPINCTFAEVESKGWKGDVDSLLYETIDLTLKQNLGAPELKNVISKRGIYGFKFILNTIIRNSRTDFKDRSIFLSNLHKKFVLIK